MNSYKTELIELFKNKYLPFVLGVPLFFCLQQYSGIVFDAVLYLLQVVNSFDPGRFENDLPFMFGNQDSLGFFSPLYRVFIEVFGIANGSMFLCFVCQFIFALSLVLLIRNLFKSEKLQIYILPLLIIFLFVISYKMPNTRIIFVEYVQPYNCSRLLSCALGILGLVFLFDEKKWLSILLFFLGTVVHPLTAGWGLPIWLFVYFPKFRLPIVVFSLIAPFSFLLHWKSLDFYFDDWMLKPLMYRPRYGDVFRQVIYVVFFGHFIKSDLSNNNAKLSQNLAIVLGIAFYWNIWGGLGEHILFYQLQTWRAEWLAQTLTFPFFAVALLKSFSGEQINSLRLRIIKWFLEKKNIALLLMGLSLFLPWHSITFALGAVLLWHDLKKKLELNRYFFVGCCVLFYLALAVYQSVNNLALMGAFQPPKVLEYFVMNKDITDSLLLLSFLTTVFWCVYAILQKKWFALAILLVFMKFPQFTLIPLLSLLLLFKSEFNNKRKFIAVVLCFLLIVICDALFYSDIRESDILKAIYGSCTKITFFIAVICLFACCAYLNRQRFKKESKLSLLFFVVFLCIYAGFNWDVRSEKLTLFECGLDEFYAKSIFPDKKNRGRMFFHVNGENSYIPRLQFLTGSYLSYNSHIGEIFFKEQFEGAVKRDNNLYYKEQKNIVSEKAEYQDFVLRVLSNRDSLIDRMNFLCGIDEIDYVVSDDDHLMKKKIDSYMMKNNQKVYLYECE